MKHVYRGEELLGYNRTRCVSFLIRLMLPAKICWSMDGFILRGEEDWWLLHRKVVWVIISPGYRPRGTEPFVKWKLKNKSVTLGPRSHYPVMCKSCSRLSTIDHRVAEPVSVIMHKSPHCDMEATTCVYKSLFPEHHRKEVKIKEAKSPTLTFTFKRLLCTMPTFSRFLDGKGYAHQPEW